MREKKNTKEEKKKEEEKMDKFGRERAQFHLARAHAHLRNGDSRRAMRHISKCNFGDTVTMSMELQPQKLDTIESIAGRIGEIHDHAEWLSNCARQAGYVLKAFTRTSATFAALGPAQNAQKIEQGGHIKGMTLELKDLLKRYEDTLKRCPALGSAIVAANGLIEAQLDAIDRERKQAAVQVEKERKEAAPKGAARANEAQREIGASGVKAMASRLEQQRGVSKPHGAQHGFGVAHFWRTNSEPLVVREPEGVKAMDDYASKNNARDRTGLMLRELHKAMDAYASKNQAYDPVREGKLRAEEARREIGTSVKAMASKLERRDEPN